MPKISTLRQRRYDETHTRQITLKLNLKTDADILWRLGGEDNTQGYIKALIREDIRKRGGYGEEGR